MPRVNSQTRSTRGKVKECGRCFRVIQPGETYYSWSFRYGGTHVRCRDHYPRASELTQSKMAQAYAAAEEFEDGLDSLVAPEAREDGDYSDLVDEVASLASTAGDSIREVAEEYREAAEAMGEAGQEHEERADYVEAWAEEFDSLEVPEPEDFIEEEDEDEGDEDRGGGTFDFDNWKSAVFEAIPEFEG